MNTSDEIDCETLSKQRIAVIGIHGVGDHDPGDVSRAITEQLLSVPRRVYEAAAPEGRVYLQAEGRTLFPATAGPEKEPSQKPWESFKRGFGSGFLSRRRRNEIPSDAPIDQRFTAALLSGGRDYVASCKAHVQPLLRQTDKGAIQVDVYDMHWADLSHGGSTSGFKVFDQFAQLMLHVASLGRSTLATVFDQVHVEGQDRERLWRWMYKCSAFGYWLLSMPILQGNLLFLLLAGLLLPALLPTSALAPAFGMVIGLLVAVTCGALGFRDSNHGTHGWVVPGSMLIGIVVGGAAGSLAAGKAGMIREMLTGIELLAFLAIGHLAMRRHGKSRPGSLGVWWMLVAALVLLSWIAPWQGQEASTPVTPATERCLPSEVSFKAGCIGEQDGRLNCSKSAEPNCSKLSDPIDREISSKLLDGIAHTLEGLFMALVGIWLGLFAVNGLLVVLAGSLWLASKDKSDEKLRAVWTALIAAAIPPPLLLSVILLAWTMLSAAFSQLIPDQDFTPWLCIFAQVKKLNCLPQAMIAFSATGGLVFYLALMASAALLLLWAVLPSVMAEIAPPKFGATGTEMDRKEKRSTALGNWLDSGFSAMGIAVLLAWIGFFLVLPIADYQQAFSLVLPDWLCKLMTLGGMDTDAIVAKISASFGAGATTVLAGTRLFGKNFANFFGRLRVLVDTALDVDNWLRERPRGNTPRLRIFARYHALLRQIEKGGYDKLIVVAHSQGTVVTADFFRYLDYRKRPGLEKGLPPTIFFTMGCPLRQLYAWRFPALYGWVNRPPHTTQAGPNPAECGFVAWHNAFGSGDYVGRYLWASANPPAPWKPIQAIAGNWPNTEEFCVGPQAHTHYFDVDNVAIGQRLDYLIRRPL